MTEELKELCKEWITEACTIAELVHIRNVDPSWHAIYAIFEKGYNTGVMAEQIRNKAFMNAIYQEHKLQEEALDKIDKKLG